MSHKHIIYIYVYKKFLARIFGQKKIFQSRTKPKHLLSKYSRDALVYTYKALKKDYIVVYMIDKMHPQRLHRLACIHLSTKPPSSSHHLGDH
jgi:hypothetical protein